MRSARLVLVGSLSLVSLASLSWARDAWATPALYTPYPCDDTYSVTQGHNTGSHTGMGAWAWDIGIPVGGEVAAPADGVVRLVRMDSTTGGCSSTYANDANYVVLDFGDGTEALFLHLDSGSSSLEVGDFVKQGEVVGAVGLTGWVCGAHLHFQIQQTCASWWCQSVSSSFVGFGDPGLGVSMPSNNCPPLEPCAPLDGGVTIVDEEEACFSKLTSYWWSEPEGYDGHHYFTYGIVGPESETVGTYSVDVTVGGTYLVEAHVPQGASTTAARYLVDPGSGQAELALVDQSTQKGWVALGEVVFAEGAGRTVVLGDATGESPDLDRRVAFDALRFTFVPDEPLGGGGGAGGGGAGQGGGGASQGGASGGAGEGAGQAGGAGLVSSQGGGSSAAPAGATGCSCRLGDDERGPSGRGLGALLVTLAALALGRRERRRAHRKLCM
jgi:murein DD-endopeptidase MepM/ murein hydrolase activator NlpD